MDQSIENRLNLCSDIEYFTWDTTPKFYFRLKPEPIGPTTQWHHDITSWDCLQHDKVKINPGWSATLVTNDLGSLILNLRNFCYTHKCVFKGEHYQYPTNRIVEVTITDQGPITVDSYQGGPNNYNAFIKHIKKKFGLIISPIALSRISAEDYPDEIMFRQLIQETIVFRHSSRHLCYKIKKSKKTKK